MGVFGKGFFRKGFFRKGNRFFFFPFLGMEFQQRHHQITNISTNQRNNPRNNKTITMRSEGIELDRNGFTNHTKATHVDLTI